MQASTNQMRDLLLILLRPLVNNPEDISIEPVERGGTVILELKVNKEDMGKVIGKGGRRAEALRTVLKAQAARLKKRVILDIQD